MGTFHCGTACRMQRGLCLKQEIIHQSRITSKNEDGKTNLVGMITYNWILVIPVGQVIAAKMVDQRCTHFDHLYRDSIAEIFALPASLMKMMVDSFRTDYMNETRGQCCNPQRSTSYLSIIYYDNHTCVMIICMCKAW